MSESIPPKQNQSQGLINIFFSVIIPVFILNKLSEKLGAETSLILALAFPIGWGAYQFFRFREFSFVAILGFLNTLITGGFALLKLSGDWFAIKEAAFPGLIGIFVFGSTFFDKPFIGTLILNPMIMNLDKINEQLGLKNNLQKFNNLLKQTNIALALSFFLSSFLNFVLAVKIFSPLDQSLSSQAQSQVLNSQIAEMTYKGMIVIAIPSFVILISIFFYFTNRLSKLTDLKLDDLIKNQ